MGFDLKVKKKAESSNEGEAKKGGFSFGGKKSSSDGDKADSASKPKGFLKTGAAAKAAMEKHEAEVAARKEKAGRAYRFWLKAGEDATITFLDGQIDPDTGILNIPYQNEHRVKIDGKFEDFLCTDEVEPCPLCAAGERKTFVGYLTIIDHRPRSYKDQNGKDVEVEATRRLFVAKTGTIKQLTKMAEKRENGLAGVTFEVSRSSDKVAAVGDLFDEMSKHTLAEIEEHFGAEIGTVINYEEELPFVPAEELVKLGIGKKVATIGSKSFSGSKSEDIDEDKVPW